MKQPKTLRAVRPNKGIELAYRKKLLRLIDEMQKSVTYWLEAAYKREQPIIAKDATPADELQKVLRKHFIQWRRNFNRKAKDLADWFVWANYKYTESALKDRIKSFKQTAYGKMFEDAGFTFELKMTPAMRNTMQSFINENVNLIKSIPEKYFTEVEGMVMRSVRSGRDLAYLSDELENRYGITRRRAVLIARDQNNKATEQMNRTRQMDLGIKKGIWRHAGGVKEPRESHKAADGKIFDLNEGLKIDGEYVYPGEMINCHCYYEPIIEEFL